MSKILSVLFITLTIIIINTSNINAAEVIAFRCDLNNIADENEQFILLISKSEESFYVVPNVEGGKKGDKLLLHVPSELATLISIDGLKITLIELLGSGGVNTTSIDIKTKEAWHSRHTLILSQYKGQCKTNLF